jgi:phosphoribosylformylglycinamidine (FGAM) synthase PurS component
MEAYIPWLQETELPMLYTYTMPGNVNPNGSTAEWAEANMKNIKTVNVGEGFHYVIEDQSEALAAALIAWYERLF